MGSKGEPNKKEISIWKISTTSPKIFFSNKKIFGIGLKEPITFPTYLAHPQKKKFYLKIYYACPTT